MWQIRRADPREASELTAIAVAAKRHWGYPEAWMERWHDDLSIAPGFVATELVFAAYDAENAIVGFYALRDTRAGCELEHLWVLPRAMGRGVGRALFEHSVEQARAAGCQVLHIDADPHAAAFYERMGAEAAGVVSAPMDDQPRVRPQYRLMLSVSSPSADGDARAADTQDH